MSSLTQLLASHGRVLILDAASTRVHVGLLQAAAPAVWRSKEGEAGTILFAAATEVFHEANTALDDIGAFVFCEGPGSMLGIRTVAMAVRTWQVLKPRPAFSYQSLVLIAHEIRRSSGDAPFSVIADARRDTWHRVSVSAAGIEPLQRTASTQLAASGERLVQPAAFRSWTPSPRTVVNCPYDVAALVAAHANTELFTAAATPDAFQHELPEYKKWSAQMHSAETAPRR
jgi:tRNA threonylcarbamoyladenosine biosynthesis protein TsaB